MNAKFLIRVGNGAEYQRRYGRNGFVVYRKTWGSGVSTSVSYIIAKEGKSSVSEAAPIPTSVLQEFSSQEQAIATLDKWATSRRDPPLLKPAPPPTAFTRKNCNRPRSRKDGPGQQEFTF